MSEISELPRPAFPFIEVRPNGEALLVAQRCTKCGATYADNARPACGRCGAREQDLELFHPQATGTLHSAVIVRRGYPGVPTPFISAVVDLDGGPTVKGTLRGVEFDPSEIQSGRRVKVEFNDALGRKDKDGNSYVAHHFEPA